MILSDVSNALELTALELILDRFEENDSKLKMMCECATDAFHIMKVLPLPEDAILASRQLLKMSSLAVIGNQGSDVSQILKQIEWPDLPFDSGDWGKRVWATTIDVWLRLICKKGWEDIGLILKRIAELRIQQKQYEKTYLDGVDAAFAKTAALELIGLYHLIKAAEILTLFITDGVVDGNSQIRQLLEKHFDRALAVCTHARMIDFELMTRLLSATVLQMVENLNDTSNSFLQ